MKRQSNKTRYCHCGKIALYRVFKVGYCRDHYDEAVKDQAGVLAKQKAFAIAAGFKKGAA